MSRHLPFESSLCRALSKIRQRPSSRRLVVPTTEATSSSFGNEEFTDSGKALRRATKRGDHGHSLTISASKKTKKEQQQQLYRYHHYKKQYLLRRETREAKKKNSKIKNQNQNQSNPKNLQSPRIWKVADDIYMQYSWGETVVGPALNTHNKYDDGDGDGIDRNGAARIGVGVGVSIGDDDDSCGESLPRCEVSQDQAAGSVASPRILPQPHPQHPQHKTPACADHSATVYDPQNTGGKESPPVEQPRSFVVGELVWVIQGKTDHLATCVGVDAKVGKGDGCQKILVQWAVNKLKQRIPLSSARAFEMDNGRRRRTRPRHKTKR